MLHEPNFERLNKYDGILGAVKATTSIYGEERYLILTLYENKEQVAGNYRKSGRWESLDLEKSQEIFEKLLCEYSDLRRDITKTEI